jgi:hypothetical protein
MSRDVAAVEGLFLILGPELAPLRALFELLVLLTLDASEATAIVLAAVRREH